MTTQTKADPLGQVQITDLQREIAEHKRAEQERERLMEQIQEQAEQVRQIVDTVPEGMLLLDADERVALTNRLGERYLTILSGAAAGDTLAGLGGRPLQELLTSPPSGLWHEVATDGWSFEVIARPIEIGPTPGGWVMVIRDVTQQREAEQRIQQQERLAAVGQLAAGIAHDFNNIMAAISLYTEISLLSPDLPARIHERLEIINRQTQRASTLTQQILDFSRRAVLERGPLDLLTFLKEQVKFLQHTLPESIQIELSYGEGAFTVKADPTRIQQAIMNLATNARDAMPEGGHLRIELGRIHVEAAKEAPLPEMGAGDWVRLAVIDSGTGIPPEVLPHIFDPFFTTKPPGKGAGLGLAQVYGIVRQHQGQVDVHSRVGEGSTFSIYLPALAEHQAEPSVLEIDPMIQGQGQAILVVEDEEATRAAVVNGLEMLGYGVLEATDGQDALAIFEERASQVSLVLSDMVMPRMGGKALFQALRQRQPTVKIVLMTGHPLDEKEIEALLAQGLKGWLPKPPTLKQLAQVIARALEGEIERPGEL